VKSGATTAVCSYKACRNRPEYKGRTKATLSHQKNEGKIGKELRSKATVMNMATVRNLVVISDKFFVRNIPYLSCKYRIIEHINFTTWHMVVGPSGRAV